MTATPPHLNPVFASQLWCLRLWRIGKALKRRGIPVVPEAIRVLVRVLFSADLPLGLDLPDDLLLLHNGLGVAINPDVRLAGPAIVFQHVAIGNLYGRGALGGDEDGAPVIDRYVMVGAGAKLLGPITIGEGCVIGANAVLTRDLPPYHTAYGNPAVIEPLDPGYIDRLFARAPKGA